MIQSEIGFTTGCGKAHEDEDQLKDGTRESEVNTNFILILWMDGYNLQAEVQIKSRSQVTRG